VVERLPGEGNAAQERGARAGCQVLPREAPYRRRAGQSRSHRSGREEEDGADGRDPPISHRVRGGAPARDAGSTRADLDRGQEGRPH
jgi:hypothetical protein